MNQSNIVISDYQKDILQELMNIAFGNATADLTNIIDIHIELSVPDIELLAIRELPEYISETIDTYSETVIINQKFLGDFKGSGLFVFPSSSGHDLSALFEESGFECSQLSGSSLKIEIVMEIGNILIGACVGKISELLNTSVIYSPPQAIFVKENKYDSLVNLFDSSQSVIVMKTRFQQKKGEGFILIITDQIH